MSGQHKNEMAFVHALRPLFHCVPNLPWTKSLLNLQQHRNAAFFLSFPLRQPLYPAFYLFKRYHTKRHQLFFYQRFLLYD